MVLPLRTLAIHLYILLLPIKKQKSKKHPFGAAMAISLDLGLKVSIIIGGYDVLIACIF